MSPHTVTTPQDLIAAVIADGEYPSAAAIARTSGRSYQTIHRWAHGKVGNISQDDMADLLIDLELRPEDYGVKPSTEWKRRRLQRGPGAAVIDPAHGELLAAMLDGIATRVGDIPEILDRLAVITDQLARIEARLPPVEETA